METLRQVAGGLLLAAFSAALVIGGISLALAESYVPEIPTPKETPAAPATITNTPVSQVSLFTPETQPVISETASPPASCQPPANWIPITVGSGEDLTTLALRYQSTTEELSQANCLLSSDLPTSSVLYVPPIPTDTVPPCGPPTGWVRYTVKAGNTMYSISHAYGISIPELQYANCIPSNQYGISTGQSLWVPNVAITRTPFASATATLTPISIIFPTLTSSPTATFTATITNTPTSTSTPTATVAPPTATPTATATVTSFPSSTPTP